MSTSPTDDLAARRAAEREALDNCESEPIQYIGTIQPFGFLVATDRRLERITHVSSNVLDHTGVEHARLLGQGLDEHLPREILHTLRNSAGHSTIESQREHAGTTTFGLSETQFDVSVHASADNLLLEFQPVRAAAASSDRPLAMVQRTVARSAKCSTIQEMLELLVHELRTISGYDRVKAYRFLPDGAGEIAAESRTPEVSSFLGQRFPAFDIPQSARKLYAATPIRLITSVAAEQPPIATAAGQADLDLSLSILRGTVDVHSMYLRNMGVSATMSLPIVVNGEMWGLFAFHHYDERAPDAVSTTACELIGQTASMLIGQLAQRAQAERVTRCQSVAQTHFLRGESPLGLASYWGGLASDLTKLVPSDGVALVEHDRVEVHGSCPDPQAIQALAELVINQGRDHAATAFGFDCLADEFPVIRLDPAAGALVVVEPLPTAKAIIFFRKPVAQVIQWAGGPDKDLEETDDGLRLQPRSSFAEYRESVEDRCEAWTADDQGTARALHVAYSLISATEAGRDQQRERLGLLVRELNHRVRNILALVHSLIGQTEVDAISINDYVESLRARIAALAGAHDLFTDNDWGPVRLEVLMNRALRPFLNAASERIRIGGPNCVVDADVSNVLVLVIHELASNASKYGSLSNDRGVVDLTWEAHDDAVQITWSESGGPGVTAPTRSGFGTAIIRDALAFEFDAQTELAFKPTGVVARFEVPSELSGVSADPAVNRIQRDSPTRPMSRPQTAPNISEPLRLLLVEDDFLIAKETSAIVEADGRATPVVVSSIERALGTIAEQEFDIVLLDVNLRGSFSGPVALELQRRKIPFVFVTGYGSRDQELAEFEHLEVITKPITAQRLATALDAVRPLDS